MTINTKTGHVKIPRNTALNSAKEIKKLQTSKNPTLHTVRKIEVMGIQNGWVCFRTQ